MQSNKYVFHLIGNNIQTSLSPSIHNYLFSRKGVDHLCNYSCYKDGEFPSLMIFDQCCEDSMRETGILGGLSVTIPFKKYFQQNGMIGEGRLVNQVKSQISLKTGVINTIVKIAEEKNYIGYNTDYWAIEKMLDPVINIITKENNGKKINAAVLGAGATSQTFCYYLDQHSKCSSIHIYNRTAHKIQELNKKYPKVKIKKSSRNSDISLLINTLPTSALNDSAQSIITFLSNKYQFSYPNNKQFFFMDVNYRDKQGIAKEFLNKLNKSLNQSLLLSILPGIDMLIYQAIEQNRLFLSGLNLPHNQIQIKDEELLLQIKNEIIKQI